MIDEGQHCAERSLPIANITWLLLTPLSSGTCVPRWRRSPGTPVLGEQELKDGGRGGGPAAPNRGSRGARGSRPKSRQTTPEAGSADSYILMPARPRARRSPQGWAFKAAGSQLGKCNPQAGTWCQAALTASGAPQPRSSPKVSIPGAPTPQRASRGPGGCSSPPRAAPGPPSRQRRLRPLRPAREGDPRATQEAGDTMAARASILDRRPRLPAPHRGSLRKGRKRRHRAPDRAAAARPPPGRRVSGARAAGRGGAGADGGGWRARPQLT